MELRIDRLLTALRDRPTEILAAIDRDPLLIRREIGGLVLANASKALFTPSAEHHLYAKGIVYQRDPYRLVSLPLLKIYNLGERNVTAQDVIELSGTDSKLHFLRKFDGTMIQRFQSNGHVYFTTRGMIEGVGHDPQFAMDEDESNRMFDYLAAARKIAEQKYPFLVHPQEQLEGVSLVLELIHPEARVITDYRGREDLVLLAAFDREQHEYWPVDRLRELSKSADLTFTDVLSPNGSTLPEQIDSLIAELAGTDEEGTVLVVEQGDAVVYRVKIKSPAYLQLLRLMVGCTYSATVELIDSLAVRPTWPEFEMILKAKGTDQIPEEVLGVYREHFEAFQRYLAGCAVVQNFVQHRSRELREKLPPGDVRSRRKAYAALVAGDPFAGLLFSAFDDRLRLERVREFLPEPKELEGALEKIGAKCNFFPVKA